MLFLLLSLNFFLLFLLFFKLKRFWLGNWLLWLLNLFLLMRFFFYFMFNFFLLLILFQILLGLFFLLRRFKWLFSTNLIVILFKKYTLRLNGFILGFLILLFRYKDIINFIFEVFFNLFELCLFNFIY